MLDDLKLHIPSRTPYATITQGPAGRVGLREAIFFGTALSGSTTFTNLIGQPDAKVISRSPLPDWGWRIPSPTRWAPRSGKPPQVIDFAQAYQYGTLNVPAVPEPASYLPTALGLLAAAVTARAAARG